MAVAALAFALAGCAGAPPSPEALAANDPYEAGNRKVLAFNQKLDKYFVGPTVGAYLWLVPEFGRNRVHDFLNNLWLPTTFINDVLQGEPKRAGQTAARFIVNATVGAGGLFDPATAFHMPDHREDFGLTLGTWGVGEGPYMVLPLLGPDPPRDSFGQVTDYFMFPLHWVRFKQHIWWDAGRYYFTLLDLRAQNYQTLQGIQRTSIDYYASLRSLYRQSRNAAIGKGQSDLKNLPKF
jgi:phospholipid-binding lipoprotein MlaA